MKFILKINGTELPEAAYVGWTPVKCTLTIDDYSGELPIPVTITTGHDGLKGRISLYESNATSSEPVDIIKHNFQPQEELTFYVAGKFPHASVAKKDTFIQIESPSEEIPALTKKVMVRVRKNANKLEREEIENFLSAFVKLNNLPPREAYSEDDYVAKPSQLLHEIVLMHTLDAVFEIHQRTSFHPWHRAFLLHLERELQAFDPSVTVPYWKFDEGADRVFTSIFIGITEKSFNPDSGPVDTMRPTFDRTNPLYSYADHTIWGGLRRAYFDSNPATGKPLNTIYNEDRIIKGPQPTPEFPNASPDDFRYWSRFEEENSHDGGHVAFTGHVVDPGKDPVDPLFFMMHSNVDRLWALWQEKHKRFDGNEEKTYPFQGKYDGKRGDEWAADHPNYYIERFGFYWVNNDEIGNYASDSLWPWNLDHVLSRPMRRYIETGEFNKVPQINVKFPNSITSNYPDNSVTVKSTIDYQDRINAQTALGFDYDSIPYFDHDRKPFDETLMPIAEDHNEIFLNKNLSVAERLEASDQGFIQKKDDQEAALNILRDNKEEEVIRLRASGLIDLKSESFLDTALEIIANESEPTDLRSKLIQEFIASKRFNLHFPSRKPRFFDLLRGLITSKDQKLRFQAIDILASHEDEVVQEFLIEEIQKDQSEFISKPDAIFFLRQNTKPQHAKLFREVFERSEDPEVKKAAIEGLGNDPDSVELLKKVVQDEAESFKVREAGALSLHHLDNETMNDLAAQIIAEPESGDGINLFRSVSPDPDEVDFKTGLLNMLTFTGNPNRLNQNEGLKSSLNQLMDQSPDDKSNFRGSTEALAAVSKEEPTMIEQMAAKLLSRLEASDEDK